MGIRVYREAQKMLAHSWDDPQGSPIVQRSVRNSKRRLRTQREDVLARKELVRELETVTLGIEFVGEGCLPSLFIIGRLIYLYTEQASSGGLRVSSKDLHSPGQNSNNKRKKSEVLQATGSDIAFSLGTEVQQCTLQHQSVSHVHYKSNTKSFKNWSADSLVDVMQRSSQFSGSQPLE